MTNASNSPGTAETREERLAAKLRENLHRRKAQARAQQAAGPADATPGQTGDDNESGRLPKPGPES